MASHKRARMVAGRMLTARVREVTFEMVDPPAFERRAGQYGIFQAPGPEGRIIKRAVSFCSPPEEAGRITLCIRRNDGIVSNYMHAIAPGTEVLFGGPWGKFTVPDGAEAPLVFVATGTGVTPAHAILRSRLAAGDRRPIRLLWGLRHEADVFYGEAFAEMARAHPNLTGIITLSQAGPDWPGARGRVTEHLATGTYPDDALYFLSGNAHMVTDAKGILKARGVPEEAIRTEVFFTPGEVKKE